MIIGDSSEGSIIEGFFIKYGDTKVSYKITPQIKDAIIKRLLSYYSEHLYTGEGISQDDNSIIEAPEVLCDIADNIIKFEEEDV
jgi:hypothetical protein